MQRILQPLAQRQGNGYSATYGEPGFRANSLLIRITNISVNSLGSIVFKLQHSADGSDWLDVPGLTTQGLSTVGATTVTVNPPFACLDYMRIAWVFNNANRVTFYGVMLGE